MHIKRVGTFVAGATAAAAAAAMLTVAPANAAEEWAAIAYSPATGAMGMSANVYSRADAERGAIADCVAHGGSDCQGVTSISNGCVALAISDDGAFHGGEGPDMRTAAEHAVASNGGGRLHQFACAL
jgi:serine/threonine-protein kinase